MPPVVRLGVDPCDGSCGNVPNVPISSSPDVFANGIKVVRESDTYAPHPLIDPHVGRKQSSGSPTVFANGLQLARIGDPINCGAHSGSGSPDVYVGA